MEIIRIQKMKKIIAFIIAIPIIVWLVLSYIQDRAIEDFKQQLMSKQNNE